MQESNEALWKVNLALLLPYSANRRVSCSSRQKLSLDSCTPRRAGSTKNVAASCRKPMKPCGKLIVCYCCHILQLEEFLAPAQKKRFNWFLARPGAAGQQRMLLRRHANDTWWKVDCLLLPLLCTYRTFLQPDAQRNYWTVARPGTARAATRFFLDPARRGLLLQKTSLCAAKNFSTSTTFHWIVARPGTLGRAATTTFFVDPARRGVQESNETFAHCCKKRL